MDTVTVRTSESSRPVGYRLDGERVRVRTMLPEDLSLISQWWTETEANRLDGGDEEGPSIQFQESFRNKIRKGREKDWFVIEARHAWRNGRNEAGEEVQEIKPWPDEDVVPVGYMIYRTYPTEPTGLEVAMRLSKPFWGKGYGSEAFGLYIGHLFRTRTLDHIWLTVYTYNDRAIRLYEKAGFREVETFTDEKGLELFKMTLSREEHRKIQIGLRKEAVP